MLLGVTLPNGTPALRPKPSGPFNRALPNGTLAIRCDQILACCTSTSMFSKHFTMECLWQEPFSDFSHSLKYSLSMSMQQNCHGTAHSKMIHELLPNMEKVIKILHELITKAQRMQMKAQKQQSTAHNSKNDP